MYEWLPTRLYGASESSVIILTGFTDTRKFTIRIYSFFSHVVHRYSYDINYGLDGRSFYTLACGKGESLDEVKSKGLIKGLRLKKVLEER